MRREDLQIGNSCKVRIHGRAREAKIVAIGGEAGDGVFTVTVRSADGRDHVVASSMVGYLDEDPREVVLQTIAREELGIITLDLRGGGSLDLHRLHVSKIRDALERAYEAGRRAERSAGDGSHELRGA
ncbi:MAG TPA: hypothetical protein DEP35_06390 [Deltaproteobacteria bacterium]|jgi:hypothetical protein|nr:hypothetical protein [Deltaproteobacteria bacterium]